MGVDELVVSAGLEQVERMMRMVMVEVRTAAILSTASGQRSVGERGRTELPGDNGPDSIIGASWFDNEPEQDVGRVDDPDGLSSRGELMKRDRGKKEDEHRRGGGHHGASTPRCSVGCP